MPKIPFPSAEDQRPLAERAAEVLARALHDQSPPALTARDLHRLPLGQFERLARRVVRQVVQERGRRAYIDQKADPDAAFGEGDTVRRETEARQWLSAVEDIRSQPRPGRAGRDDKTRSQLAKRYVEIGGTSPIKDLADELSLSPSTVRNIVSDLRRDGFLTATTKGRAGGELTPKSIELLSQQED